MKLITAKVELHFIESSILWWGHMHTTSEMITTVPTLTHFTCYTDGGGACIYDES